MKDDTFSEQFYRLQEVLNYVWGDVKKRRVTLNQLSNLIDRYLKGLKDE